MSFVYSIAKQALKPGNHSVEVSVTDLKYKININDLTHEAAALPRLPD